MTEKIRLRSQARRGIERTQFASLCSEVPLSASPLSTGIFLGFEKLDSSAMAPCIRFAVAVASL